MNDIATELNRRYEEISATEFYREIFPAGELQVSHEKNNPDDPYDVGMYQGIILEITDKMKKVTLADGRVREKPVVRRYYVTDEQDNVDLMLHSPYFCVLAPVSYAGKERKNENARFLYAMVIEVDGLLYSEKAGYYGLKNLIKDIDQGYIPKPTYLVASGTGVHMYWRFERPIPLYRNILESLQHYHTALTRRIWHQHVTEYYKDKDIQFESVCQAYRMVGTRTKDAIKSGTNDICRAYRVGDEVSIDYMNSFIRTEGAKIREAYKSQSGYNLKTAREKWPEWYQERVVEKRPKKPWPTNRSVYEWWKSRIVREARGGHRYYCLMMLVIYAVKCGVYDEQKNPNPVTRDELEADCWELEKVFDQIEYINAQGKEDRFSDEDVLDALDAYDNFEVFTYPINSIQNRSGIEIAKNKRNYRNRSEHLGRIRAMQKYDDPSEGWRNNEGRPKAESVMLEYMAENPDVTNKAKIARETGLSRTTVTKWWKILKEGVSEENYWQGKTKNGAEQERPGKTSKKQGNLVVYDDTTGTYIEELPGPVTLEGVVSRVLENGKIELQIDANKIDDPEVRALLDRLLKYQEQLSATVEKKSE